MIACGGVPFRRTIRLVCGSEQSARRERCKINAGQSARWSDVAKFADECEDSSEYPCGAWTLRRSGRKVIRESGYRERVAVPYHPKSADAN
jgi:hypothetical protein